MNYLEQSFVMQGADPDEVGALCDAAREHAEAQLAELHAAQALGAFAYGCAKRWAAGVGHPLREMWGGLVSEWAAVGVAL